MKTLFKRFVCALDGLLAKFHDCDECRKERAEMLKKVKP